jgi:hypothetical protein
VTADATQVEVAELREPQSRPPGAGAGVKRVSADGDAIGLDEQRVRGHEPDARGGGRDTEERAPTRSHVRERSAARGSPADLELQLVDPSLAFVLHGELGIGRYPEPLAGHLDGERLARLERVREPPELGDELRTGVRPLEIAIRT